MPSNSPTSRTDFRRIGVVAGVALVACAAILVARTVENRKPDQAQPGRHAFALPGVARGGVRTGSPGSPRASLAPALVTAHGPAAAKAAPPARPGTPVVAVAKGSPAVSPAKGAPVAAVVNGAPGAKAAPAVKPFQKASMVPGVAARPAVAVRAMVRAAGGDEAQPTQALQADPDADFGMALPLRSQYAYNPDGRRDPFQSLLKGEFETEQGSGGQPLVDVADLALMGVMAAGNDRYAMVEDSKHHGFTLRVGDPVMNGRVARIEDNCLTVNLSSYGETQTVKLHLNTNRNPKGGRP
jgi:hypothetical protein